MSSDSTARCSHCRISRTRSAGWTRSATASGELEDLEAATVAAARAAGVTWTEIGALYGLSKQGAQQRFRRP